MVRFRLLCGDFLLSDPAPHLENRKTVCMGYPAKTSQERAGKRRRKGAGNPCRENGAPNINWSKWPVDVVNDTKRHSPEKPYALRLTSCGHFDHMRQIGRSLNQCRQFVHIDFICVTFDFDLTFCQATVKSGKCRFPVFARLL